MDPRFEIVRTDAGFHARFRAANGRIVWVTESLTKRRHAVRAVELICGDKVHETPYNDRPEIYWQGNDGWPSEVYFLDEREARP